jgi:acetyl-CoA carboxylase biotin carboxyl carrier protein
MDPKELKRLLDALKDASVSEFSLETPEYKVSVKRGAEVVYAAAPVAPTAPVYQSPPPVQPTVPSAPPTAAAQPPVAVPAAETPSSAPATSSGHVQKAPIVGTFYASSSPEASPFVQVGSRVEAGKILCIIEAMKLMNEIEAEVSGVIKEILVKNAQPVEYGQPLFVIE